MLVVQLLVAKKKLAVSVKGRELHQDARDGRSVVYKVQYMLYLDAQP